MAESSSKIYKVRQTNYFKQLQFNTNYFKLCEPSTFFLYHLLVAKHRTCDVDPCHHGIARPQFADEGTAPRDGV